MAFGVICGDFGVFYPNFSDILITHFLLLENILEKRGKNGLKRA
jgi:hypothetical protein